MRYEGSIYRPPGEWRSYLLQVTVGCSHNACTFCGMYKDKKYRVRPMGEILEDIRMARAYYGDVRRVFLCDGDAIAVDTEDLLVILRELYAAFPSLEKVTTYAGPRSTLRKGPEELRALRDAGLARTYLGVETGSDALLRRIHKGVGAAEMLEAGIRLREAGFDLWIMVLLGLAGGGGEGLVHMRETAKMANAMRPRHLSALTLTLSPGTALYRDWREGRFQPAAPADTLREAGELIRRLEVDPLHFTCDHASNYVPLSGSLPQDREGFLARLDQALESGTGLRPEWARGL